MVRAGYSVVGPKAWLRPHFGATNGVLKLHLGLTVPSQKSGEPCARLKVAKRWGHWVEGDVILFVKRLIDTLAIGFGNVYTVTQIMTGLPNSPTACILLILFIRHALKRKQ